MTIKIIDSIVSQFDNSKTTFTLKVSSVNVTPTSTQNLLVSLGGIFQSPNLAYSVTGANITFATAPFTSEDCFMILLPNI